LPSPCSRPAPRRPSARSATRAIGDRFLAPAEAKAGKTIDVLVVSGGGDWGAFGAGVLKGGGRVKGELARPQFDVVTGVSTGALIAPFAFLGDEASIERIVALYRNPREDIAMSRGWLFFLPANPSLYVLPGLEDELRGGIDRAMLERLMTEGAKGRTLLAGRAESLARHHGPHHDHGHTDLDPELAAPPLCAGGGSAAQVQGTHRGAPHGGA
jgi:hypothetical protein